MEDTAENTRKLYNGVLDQLPVGIMIADVRGQITCFNAVAEDLLGLKNNQVIGRSCREIFGPRIFLDCPETMFDLINDALERGIIYDQVELNALIKGAPGILKVSTRMLKNGGEDQGVLLYFSDCTTAKILEEQVRRNECLSVIGQMAAGICHEIRNPLQSVKGFVQLIQENNKSPQEISDYTEIIIDEINRINSIIKEYLQLARAPVARYEKKDLNSIVSEIILLVSSEAILRNVVIEEDLGKMIPLLMLDESRIKQVLINILANALAAIPGQGTIEVKTWYDFHFREACISIADNGIGMDKKTLDQIGRPFFTTKENGTGLGLAVSYRIIQEHGGRIQVESAPGKGTKFTIILPELAGLEEKTENKEC